MLDAVVLLGALGVVEAVERTHEIAGDAADAVELHRREAVVDADVLAIDVKRQRLQLTMGVLVVGALDVGLDLVVGYGGVAGLGVVHGHLHAVDHLILHGGLLVVCGSVNASQVHYI